MLLFRLLWQLRLPAETTTIVVGDVVAGVVEVVEVVEVEEAEGDTTTIGSTRRKAREGITRSAIRIITILLVTSKSRKLLSFTKRTRAVEKGEIIATRMIIPLPPILQFQLQVIY